MYRWRDLSFFVTKKEEEGVIILACRDDWIYSLIAMTSGLDREYNLPLGGEDPGYRSVAQS